MHLLLLTQAWWVVDGRAGEGQGMRCHFQGCPWILTHEAQARRPRQTLYTEIDRQTERQTAQSDRIGSGNFGSQNHHIFLKKREQVLASLLQNQELTKTVTSDNHFLISVFRRGWISSALLFFSPQLCGSSPRALWNSGGGKEER